VISTSAVLLSVFLGRLTDLPLDGIMGAAVALFIIYSGIKLIKETAAPLLGNPPDKELVDEIRKRVLTYEGVLGIHDLIVHNYGPGRTFATLHIEVDAHGDLIASHDMVDSIEREIAEDLQLQLVAHMDPLDTRDPLTAELNVRLGEAISAIPGIAEIHDLRVVAGYSQHKVIFDVVADPVCDYSDAELKNILQQKVGEISPYCYCVITIDRNYL